MPASLLPTPTSLLAEADRAAADAAALERAAGEMFLATSPTLAAIVRNGHAAAALMRQQAARLAMRERA